MELSKYIAQKQKVLIMAPRYISGQKIAECLLKILSKDQKVVISGSIGSHVSLDRQGVDIIIYTNPHSAIHGLSVNKYAHEIIILEWGVDSKSFTEAQEWAVGSNLASLYTGFITELRGANFDLFGVTMGPKMSKWYQEITTSKIDDCHKNRAGTVYFSGHSPDENTAILLNSHTIGNKLSKGNGQKMSSLEDLLGPNEQRGEVFTKITIDDSADNNLGLYAPKLEMIISNFEGSNGDIKYVIFTQFNKIYGVRLYYHILSVLFEPVWALYTNNAKDEKEIISQFNKAPRGILITSIIPQYDLENVNTLIINDSYKCEKIYGMGKSVV